MKRIVFILLLATLLSACSGNSDIKKLERERDELQKRINGLEIQMNSLADQAEATLAEESGKVQELTLERDTLAAQLEMVVAERDDLTMQVQQLVSQLGSMNRNLEAAQAKLAEGQSQPADTELLTVEPVPEEAVGEAASVETTGEGSDVAAIASEGTSDLVNGGHESSTDGGETEEGTAEAQVAAEHGTAEGEAEAEGEVADVATEQAESTDAEAEPAAETETIAEEPAPAETMQAPVQLAGDAHPNLPGSTPVLRDSHPNLPGD